MGTLEPKIEISASGIPMRNSALGLRQHFWLHAISLVVAPARAQEFPVQTKIRKNGMKVLVQSDHTLPNVALYIFYRIGSRNEHPGTTGLGSQFLGAKCRGMCPAAQPRHTPIPQLNLHRARVRRNHGRPRPNGFTSRAQNFPLTLIP